MSTKSKRNLEAELGPSPNPFFAKKDEPWKDPKLMLKLNEKHKYQYEIAHVLGCSESQVSYWMNKALENYQPEPSEEDLMCEYYEVCGNETPGPKNTVCDTCLDHSRQRSHEAATVIEFQEDVLGQQFTTMENHMADLYERYGNE